MLRFLEICYCLSHLGLSSQTLQLWFSNISAYLFSHQYEYRQDALNTTVPLTTLTTRVAWLQRGPFCNCVTDDDQNTRCQTLKYYRKNRTEYSALSANEMNPNVPCHIRMKDNVKYLLFAVELSHERHITICFDQMQLLQADESRNIQHFCSIE